MKNKDKPCYQCPDRFPGCSGSCDKPEYLEEQRKKKEKKELIQKQKSEHDRFTTYAVEVARKKKQRCGRKK